MLKITPTSEKQLTPQEISQAHEIMRVAYEITEEEIWGKNYIRLYLEDFTKLVEAGDIYVAYLNNVIVGSIHIYRKDETTYTFSLLSANLNLGGQGIGSALIKKAEEEALVNNATSIKIEILRVKGTDAPHKIRLHNYYERLGYKYTHSSDSSCIIPDWKYKTLLKPSDFDFYSKEL